jgi:hypothetical protein
MTQPADDEERSPSDDAPAPHGDRQPSKSTDECQLIDVYDQAPEGYEGTCLRPLGLCELGGSCDACWYNSNREDSIKQRPDGD